MKALQESFFLVSGEKARVMGIRPGLKVRRGPIPIALEQ